MHVTEQGTGPLVLMCHGFPESWYSWRHQLAALADAGFHAVALATRGRAAKAATTAILSHEQTDGYIGPPRRSISTSRRFEIAHGEETG